MKTTVPGDNTENNLSQMNITTLIDAINKAKNDWKALKFGEIRISSVEFNQLGKTAVEAIRVHTGLTVVPDNKIIPNGFTLVTL